ncbi:MAG: copper chaperone PCu(A)C [Anaerolineales bacterium]|nr:copper chaperone PCu(A)C [Anaerolineales bacterium]
MKRMVVPILVLFLAACQPTAGLTVLDPWARPGLTGGNGGVFFVITNGGEADTLRAATSEVAEAVEIHMTVMDGDLMQMQPQESVLVPAGGRVDFQPGGLHVMLIGLKEDLGEADVFELVLTFEQAGEIVLQVEVRQP